MKISVRQLKKLIREQVEEMAHSGLPEARRGRGPEAGAVYTKAQLKAMARQDEELLLQFRALRPPAKFQSRNGDVFDIDMAYVNEDGRPMVFFGNEFEMPLD